MTHVVAAPSSETTERFRRNRPPAVLSAAYGLFFVLPGTTVLVGPLRSNGHPLRLVGLACVVLALAGLLYAGRRRAVRPVALLALAFLCLLVVAWSSAYSRFITDFQSAEMDRAVLVGLSAAGITVLAAMTFTDLSAAHHLSALLIAGAMFCASVAVLQVLGIINVWPDLVTNLPMMTTVIEPSGVGDRLGLSRTPGSTIHPIEYSVCLAMVIPLGIHLATHAITASGRRLAGLAVVFVGLCLPLGLSRSGLLTVAVVLCVFVLFVTARVRLAIASCVVLAALSAPIVAPEVVGAVSELVVGAARDTSIQGRLQDYPRILNEFRTAPILGNGPAPADPELRFVIDNQWIVALVRDGLLGVLGMALLFFGGALLAARAALSQPSGSAIRSFNGALCAGLVGGAVAAVTFDTFSFHQATFLIFLLLGLVGCGTGFVSVSDRESADGESLVRQTDSGVER